jgi:(S)-2-hydroxyglutarate dehydrogenase
LRRLANLLEGGLQNGLNVTKLNREELLEKEPTVKIFVHAAGIVDYKVVAEKLAEIIREKCETIINDTEVVSIEEKLYEVTV